MGTLVRGGGEIPVRRSIAVSVLAAVVALAGCSAEPEAPAVPSSVATAATPSPSPTPSDSPVTTDAEVLEWCTDYVEDADDSTDLVSAFLDDPDTTKWIPRVGEFRASEAELVENKRTAPVFLRSGVQNMIDLLVQIADALENQTNTTVNADAYKSGASTVLDACTEAINDYSGDTEEPADDPTEEPTEPTEEPEPENSLSVAQQNAVDTAASYLDNQSFSRKGLIKQLKFEGYSTKDSEFAVKYLEDNDQVNWNKQAAKTAQNYLDNQSFSRKGLIEQLEFEGFTRKQAVYGVNEVGL